MDHVVQSSGFEATIADVAPMLLVFGLLPLIGSIVKKKGSKKTIFIGSIPYILGHLALFFTNSWWTVTLAYAPIMFGKYMMTTASAPLNAAIIDENERATGVRKTGLISAMMTLIAAPAISSQLMIFMGILTIFGYDAKSPAQSAQAMLGIRIGTALVPIIFVLAGLIPLLYLPLDKAAETELSQYSQMRRRGSEALALDETAAEEGQDGN